MASALHQLAYKVGQVYRRFTSPISLGCRALVVKDDAYLLVRHTYQDGWYLPGGSVNKGEALGAAIVRELAEEGAIAAKAPSLKHMFFSEFERRSDHIAYFIVKDFDAIPGGKPDGEIAEVGFFKIDQLPEATTAATRRRLAEYIGNQPLPERW